MLVPVVDVIAELLEKVHALDGCQHPAESHIRDMLTQRPNRTRIQLLHWIQQATKRHAVLYCLGRLPVSYIGHWLLPAIEVGLADRRSSVRELTIELAALVGARSIASVLYKRAVNEPEAHLARYMQFVAADLCAVCVD